MPITISFVEFRWWKARVACHECAGELRAFAEGVRELAAAVEELAPVLREVWIAARRWQLAIWLVRLIGNEGITNWAVERTPGWVLLRLPLQGFEEPCIPGVG